MTRKSTTSTSVTTGTLPRRHDPVEHARVFPLARVHARELEDEAWWPATLRDAMTAFLQQSSEKMRLFRDAAPVLRDVVVRHRAKSVVDLGSGGGGPILSMLREIDDVD